MFSFPRYLYAFVWHNVGVLNDNFFGFFLAIYNAFMSIYFAIFVTLPFHYRKGILYQACMAGNYVKEEQNEDDLYTAFESGGKMTNGI